MKIVDDVLRDVISGMHFNKPFSFIKAVTDAFDSIITKYSRKSDTNRMINKVVF